MRVAIVRREQYNARSMDVYADNLVAQLKVVRPKWDIVEIAPLPWSNRSNNSKNSWHSGNPLRKYYQRLWHHPRAVSRQQADLFHIIDHTEGHIAYWLKKLGKPTVITCHDLVQYVYPEILREQSRFPALSMASWRYSVRGMKLADRIVAVSDNTANDVIKMLDIAPEKVTVVPNGVDSQFRVLSGDRLKSRRQQHSDSAEEICLLNVGSTHQRKNIQTILKVVEILRARGLSVRLWKVGDDFTPEQKIYIRDRHLEPQITWLGQPERETLIEFYNAADILLAPSLYEGFGLTVLEAMACGTPVIASNVSSLPEVVGDAGILVDDPLNAPEIARLVLHLWQKPDYRDTLVANGLKRVKQYTWLRTADKMALIYEQAIATKKYFNQNTAPI